MPTRQRAMPTPAPMAPRPHASWPERGALDEPELSRGAARSRSPRSRALAVRRAGGSRGGDLRPADAVADLLLRLAGRAAGAAAEGAAGAVAAAGVPAEARPSGQPRRLQAAAHGLAALLRRPAASVAGQDRGAEPPGRYLADGARGRPAAEALPARTGAGEGLLRGAAHQDAAHRQLSSVR